MSDNQIEAIRARLHPTDPTYCAEPIDIDEAQLLLRTLDEWRQWAQFVYNNGGPVNLPDDALRERVCAFHDEEGVPARERANAAEAALAEAEAEIARLKAELAALPLADKPNHAR